MDHSAEYLIILSVPFKSQGLQHLVQAMDRAHRLGQKRTVTVYRVLMRNSLEERIMGLQRFKIDIANAVVNQVSCSSYSVSSRGPLDVQCDCQVLSDCACKIYVSHDKGLGSSHFLQDNISLSNMNTGNLLDLLHRSDNSLAAAAPQPADPAGSAVLEASNAGMKSGGLNAVLEGLEELWDENQYAEEFSLDTFVNKLV